MMSKTEGRTNSGELESNAEFTFEYFKHEITDIQICLIWF